MENKDLVDKIKGINWTSKQTIVAITSTVFGIILLGIGQFFTLQEKPDASLLDYLYSILLFTIVIIAVPSAYGTLGKLKGLSDERLKKAIEENSNHFETIGKNNWEREIEIENEEDNEREKLRVLKADTFNKLANDPQNKELQDLKKNILLYYNYKETKDKAILKKLNENNFDLSMYNVKYEHIEYNDLFSGQSTTISARQRKINIEKRLLKQAIIKRSIIVVLGGYISGYALLFGFSWLSLLMFIYQIALVSWTSFTTFNSALNLVLIELKAIIEQNNTSLKIWITKLEKRKEEIKIQKEKEEKERIKREEPNKEEEQLRKKQEQEDRERKYQLDKLKADREFELEKARIQAETEKAKAQIIANQTLQKQNNQNNKVELVVKTENEKR